MSNASLSNASLSNAALSNASLSKTFLSLLSFPFADSLWPFLVFFFLGLSFVIVKPPHIIVSKAHEISRTNYYR
ncbi:MAG: pentapeptide repeat-containing protein [Deltaproteobacteria bacterium]|nr:pentapeptide repeat-containing protein [Deltaproteobacteria bacterium]